MKHGDGWQGWSSKAPFDCIIVTAAPHEVPAALLEQLAPGGRLVIPVGHKEQVLQVYQRGIDSLSSKTVEAVRFVPLVPGELA
jgi:protein-L-isoaspartate(D-aspartate) O-methyltransferase